MSGRTRTNTAQFAQSDGRTVNDRKYSTENIPARLDYRPRVYYSYFRPARLRASSRGVSMMELDVAPAGVLSQSTHSGGAGAPLAGTMTRRQELADDAEPCEAPSEARPDAEKNAAGGAPGGALPKNGSDAPRKARLGRPSPGRPRSVIANAPRFPALRSPRGGVGLLCRSPKGEGGRTTAYPAPLKIRAILLANCEPWREAGKPAARCIGFCAGSMRGATVRFK